MQLASQNSGILTVIDGISKIYGTCLFSCRKLTLLRCLSIHWDLSVMLACYRFLPRQPSYKLSIPRSYIARHVYGFSLYGQFTPSLTSGTWKYELYEYSTLHLYPCLPEVSCSRQRLPETRTRHFGIFSSHLPLDVPAFVLLVDKTSAFDCRSG